MLQNPHWRHSQSYHLPRTHPPQEKRPRERVIVLKNSICREPARTVRSSSRSQRAFSNAAESRRPDWQARRVRRTAIAAPVEPPPLRQPAHVTIDFRNHAMRVGPLNDKQREDGLYLRL